MMRFNHCTYHQEFHTPINNRHLIDASPKIIYNENSEVSNNCRFNIENMGSNQTDSNIMSPTNIIDTRRLKFTLEEDNILKREIALHGPRKWDKIALSLPGRNGRQCRDRFQNYLSPYLTNGPWTKEEDKLLCLKVKEFGLHWNKISRYFDGRSSNNVKNRWYTHLGKKKQKKNRSFGDKKAKNDEKEYEYHEKEDNMHENNSNKVVELNFEKDTLQKKSSDDISNGSVNSFLVIDQNVLQNEASSKIFKDIIKPKNKNISKILFPPICPPNDSLIFPPNQGLFDFLNQEIS